MAIEGEPGYLQPLAFFLTGNGRWTTPCRDALTPNRTRKPRVKVVRICKRQYHSLDGYGASKHGARWNSPGRAIVYTASCAALAALESLVHAGNNASNRVLIYIEVPDCIERETFGYQPADPSAFRQIGNEWFDAGQTAIAVAPS